jgi:hypothetical protein
MNNDLMMDRAAVKLRRLHYVIEWILANYHNMPGELYQLKNGEFIPFDIKECLLELVRCDFANAITPTAMWRAIAQNEGLTVDSEPAS